MTSSLALAVATLVAPHGAHAQTAAQSDGGQDRRQTVILTLPVLRNDSPIGEIEASVTRDGAVQYESFSLVRVLEPLVSDAGKGKLASAIASEPFVGPDRLREYGFDLAFDMARLEVVLVGISTDLLLAQRLPTSRNPVQQLAPTIEAADFSAYLNLAGSFEYNEGIGEGGLRNPEILAFGAARMGRFGLHYDGGLTDEGTDGYRPYRRFVRGTYDLDERNLRASAGDLQVESLGILGTQLIGGIGIERGRRLFDPFDPLFRLGGRRLRIDSPSTIEIVNNGEVVRSISVDQGVYDLEDLPLVFGSNDVDIVIRDAAGRTSVTSFDYFFDPVDLEVGDYEFGAYVGLVSDLSSLEPDYDGGIAAAGYYRRALNASLLVGAGLQVSESVQAGAAQIEWVPQFFPGVLRSQLAVSSGSQGFGYATRLGYRWADATPAGSRQISVTFDYEDPNFELIGRPQFLNQERFSLSGSYGQSFGSKTYLSAGVNLFKLGGSSLRQTVYADVIHQFTPQLRGTVGAEYGKNDGFDNSFGIQVGVTWLFGRNSRADAAFESRRDLYRATFNRAQDDRVGAFGYDASVQHSDGRASADASLRYRGNRFDGRLAVSGAGEGISGITDNRRVQLQLATSLAVADGTFGVGRPITDGFTLVSVHPSIDGEAIVGNNLNNGEYQGRSGILGAAVLPNLTGYQTREITYDIDSTDEVYDVGNGVDRVRVRTGGGAQLTIGSARYVSAIGTLVSGDNPVSLASGSVSSESDEGFEPLPFFTNSVGRFSVIGLAAGERYRVRLRDGREFFIEVPDDNGGLYKVEIVTIEEIGQ